MRPGAATETCLEYGWGVYMNSGSTPLGYLVIGRTTMSCCSPEGTCSTGRTTEAASVTGATTVYAVSGMTCGHCEQAVGSALSALEGVTGVRVDVATGLVTVTSRGEPDDALVRAAVDEAGYELTGRADSVPARH